jgi:hypothetical protein
VDEKEAKGIIVLYETDKDLRHSHYDRQRYHEAQGYLSGLEQGRKEERESNRKLVEAIHEAINVVGGPSMDYAPKIATKELHGKIDRATKILIKALSPDTDKETK